MKWFVTDAQLAAMCGEATRIAESYTAARIAVVVERAEAEIARLRADRDAELSRVGDPQGPLVQHYRDEVAYWRGQFQHERQRAEVAIDQCRVTHQAIGPVSLPPREDRLPREFPASEEQALSALDALGGP